MGARYRLVRPLASGGMGSLWVARHTELDVDVAVKLMSDKLVDLPGARARFTREARMLAGLSSAHLVRVQDFGLDEDLPFLVMELLHGEDLGKRLDRVLRLDLAETQRLLAQIGKGLRRAHDAGLVHRDLKPSNVFLAIVDGEETAKIVDFGAAKDMVGSLDGEGTRTGEVLGSPRFMSPEHLRGAKGLDHRADLWSLAVILYRALTGMLPFDAQEIGALIAQVLTDPIPPPSAVALDLPESLDLFFFRALAREPDARFQSVRELTRAFDEALAEARTPRAERVVVHAGSMGAEATAIAPPGFGPPSTDEHEAPATLAPAAAEGAPPAADRARRARAVSGSIGVVAGLVIGLGAARLHRPAPAEPPAVRTVTAAATPVNAAPPREAEGAAPPATSAPIASSSSAAPAASASAERPAATAGPVKSDWGFRQWGF